MKKNIPFKPLHILYLSAVFLGAFLLLVITLFNSNPSLAQGTVNGTPYFLPVIHHNPPTATPQPTPVPSVPQFVKNIPLPQAQCPNDVNVNNTTGYAYVVNNFSNNVSILHNGNYITEAPTGGEWPTKATSDPNSNRTFVTNLHKLSNSGQTTTQLSLFQNTTLVTSYDQFFEGHTPLYNPTNDYLYVTDLGQNIRIFDASDMNLKYLTDISMDDGIKGWITAITYDPNSGLVFAASWSNGEIYVIQDTTLLAILQTDTWGPAGLAVDPINKHLYVTGQEVKNRPPNYPNNNVSIFATEAPFQKIQSFAITQESTSVSYDPIGGYIYVINPADNSVSIFKDGQYLHTLPTGTFPGSVKVHPQTGYAFVTNLLSRNITILKNGQLAETIPSQGIGPIAVDFDTVNNYVYVANRGIETSQFKCDSASVTILR